MRVFWVYILASRPRGALYVGVTSDLVRRLQEHKDKAVEGFTQKYGIDRLVYYEMCEHGLAAIEYEKRLKGWKRAWKIELIERTNPDWQDLSHEIT